MIFAQTMLTVLNSQFFRKNSIKFAVWWILPFNFSRIIHIVLLLYHIKKTSRYLLHTRGFFVVLTFFSCLNAILLLYYYVSFISRLLLLGHRYVTKSLFVKNIYKNAFFRSPPLIRKRPIINHGTTQTYISVNLFSKHLNLFWKCCLYTILNHSIYNMVLYNFT